VLHADGGGETAEEKTSGLEDSPEAAQHGFKVLVVAREVENGAAEDEVDEGVLEGQCLDGLDAEVRRRKSGREGCGERACGVDRSGILVYAEDLASLAQKVDEIAPEAAARIEDTHSGMDAATEKLIEEVDINGAELLLKRRHGGLADDTGAAMTTKAQRLLYDGRRHASERNIYV